MKYIFSLSIGWKEAQDDPWNGRHIMGELGGSLQILLYCIRKDTWKSNVDPRFFCYSVINTSFNSTLYKKNHSFPVINFWKYRLIFYTTTASSKKSSHSTAANSMTLKPKRVNIVSLEKRMTTDILPRLTLGYNPQFKCAEHSVDSMDINLTHEVVDFFLFMQFFVSWSLDYLLLKSAYFFLLIPNLIE